jgi:hypothetical protein
MEYYSQFSFLRRISRRRSVNRSEKGDLNKFADLSRELNFIERPTRSSLERLPWTESSAFPSDPVQETPLSTPTHLCPVKGLNLRFVYLVIATPITKIDSRVPQGHDWRMSPAPPQGVPAL